MTGGEIAILIFGIIILIGLVIGTIWFVYWYEHRNTNNNGGMTGMTGGNNNGGNTGMTGMTGGTGAIVSGKFFIRPATDNTMKITPDLSNSPPTLYVSSDASQPCANYTWTNGTYTYNASGISFSVPNALINQGSYSFFNPQNQLSFLASTNGNSALLLDNNDFSFILDNWIYNPSDKTWCDYSNNQRNCLSYRSEIPNETINLEVISVAPNSTIIPTLQWINDPNTLANCAS